MASFEFVTVDVFTDRRFGGNPLAVFPDAAGLDAATMHALARELNLSETTFVLPPAEPANAAQVRIFTPGGEIPFAGHPNVGTAFVLAQRDPALGERLVFEEAAGLVAVHLQRGADGAITGAAVEAPQSLTVGVEIPPELVAACAGLREADIRTDTHHPVFAGVGLGFVLAEVADRDALARAAPDSTVFRGAATQFPDIGNHFSVHLYARDPHALPSLRARMFAPLFGIAEDPATGSANAALAALLVSHAPGEDVTLAFDIAQGEEMGRPSRLLATARKTADGVRASVAGGCVPVLRGWVDL